MKKIYFACSIRGGRDDSTHRLSAIIDGSPNTPVVSYHEIDGAFAAITGLISALSEK